MALVACPMVALEVTRADVLAESLHHVEGALSHSDVMLHIGTGLVHNHSPPRVGVKHVVALARVRLQEHSVSSRHIVKLLPDRA